MDLIPAVDVLGGTAVRLVQGDYDRVTSFGDPLERIRNYAEGGARWLHVVDLAAARSGEPTPRHFVVELLAAVAGTGVKVQLGGGVRSSDVAEGLLAAGVARVVLGTAALEQPGLVERLATAHPGRIAVGLDHRLVAGEDGAPARRVVAVAGWERNLALGLLEALARFEGLPLGAVVVTDIGRDGTGRGPELDSYRQLLGATSLPLVASGGVSGRADLEALAGLEAAGRRLDGAIVGRALLDGRLGLREALDACAAPATAG